MDLNGILPGPVAPPSWWAGSRWHQHERPPHIHIKKGFYTILCVIQLSIAIYLSDFKFVKLWSSFSHSKDKYKLTSNQKVHTFSFCRCDVHMKKLIIGGYMKYVKTCNFRLLVSIVSLTLALYLAKLLWTFIFLFCCV